jgi:hypothetical protein
MMDEDDTGAPIEGGARYTKADLERIGAQWIERINASEKREDAWRFAAREAEDAYLCGADDDALVGKLAESPRRFNIIHSNIETIVPAIYNSTPIPDIRPRHNNDDDETARLAAQALERAIATQIDDSRMDSEIEASAQDAFLAGRGVVRIRYLEEDTGPRVGYENVSWRDYCEGPAKRWSDVEWVAFRHFISEAERRRLEDEDIAEAYGPDEKRNADDEEVECAVWEIWCRATGNVYFVVYESARVLTVKDDPLGLRGFFPIPQPVQPITGTGRRTPVCPYSVYRSQAQELDTITRRIEAIVEGLKVRGIVVGDGEAMERLSEAEDNQLVTIGNPENLAAAGGLDKAIAWWPVDKAIQVLQQLFVQREQVKQTIYEITGISDIIRGQGAASETATAQNIKTQWGSLRIKKMQRLLERQVRDLFVMTAEVIGKLFDQQALAQAAGMDVQPEVMELIKAAGIHYRIDVESDSTVRADLSRNREEMAAFVAGSAQYFQAVAPVAMQIPQASGPIVEIYTAFARTFALGKQAEDALENFAQLARSSAEDNQQAKEAQEVQKRAEAREDAKLQIETMRVENERAKIKADATIRGNQEERADAQALFGAEVTAIEIDMEGEQQRPVALGAEVGGQ